MRKAQTAMAGFDAGRGPHIKEHEQPLEVGKGVETDCQSFQKECTSVNTLILSQ